MHLDKEKLIEWLKENNYRKMTAEEIIYEIQEGMFDENAIKEKAENKSSIDLIYDTTVLQLKLDQAYQTIRAYEAMENLK